MLKSVLVNFVINPGSAVGRTSPSGFQLCHTSIRNSCKKQWKWYTRQILCLHNWSARYQDSVTGSGVHSKDPTIPVSASIDTVAG